MNEVGTESGIQQEGRKFESPSIEDDAYRMKIAALRDGVQQVLCEHGISLEPGVSSSALLDILSQVMGNPSTTVTYVEDLHSDWRDEYQRIVEQIAVMTNSEFGEKTKPQDIVKSIEEHLAA